MLPTFSLFDMKLASTTVAVIFVHCFWNGGCESCPSSFINILLRHTTWQNSVRTSCVYFQIQQQTGFAMRSARIIIRRGRKSSSVSWLGFWNFESQGHVTRILGACAFDLVEVARRSLCGDRSRRPCCRAAVASGGASVAALGGAQRHWCLSSTPVQTRSSTSSACQELSRGPTGRSRCGKCWGMPF